MENLKRNLRSRALQLFPSEGNPGVINWESLHEATGVSKTTLIEFFKRPERSLELANFRKLCYVLKVPLDDLIITGPKYIGEGEPFDVAKIYIAEETDPAKEEHGRNLHVLLNMILERISWIRLSTDLARAKILLHLKGEIHAGLLALAEDWESWSRWRPTGEELFLMLDPRSRRIAFRRGGLKDKHEVTRALEQIRAHRVTHNMSAEEYEEWLAEGAPGLGKAAASGIQLAAEKPAVYQVKPRGKKSK